MKKLVPILLLSLGIISLFISCNDSSTDYIFEDSINVRFEKLRTEYINTLTDAENGWLGFYSPNSDKIGSHVVLLDFLDDKRVAIKSDYLSGANDDTITYRIDKTLEIELVFETYAVFHKIFELDDNNIGGEFVFNITKVESDKVILTSKTDTGYGDEEITVLNLHKADSQDKDFTRIGEIEQHLIGAPYTSVFRSIKKDGTAVINFIDYDPGRRIVTVSYYDESGNLITERKTISVDKNKFCFLQPIKIADVTYDCFSYDEGLGIFVNTTINAELSYDNTPLFPLIPYNFGSANSVLYNERGLIPGETVRSSSAFEDLYNSIKEKISTELGLSLNRFFMEDLSKTPSYFHFFFDFGTVWYDFTYTKNGNKVFLTLTGATNAPLAPALTPYLKPLLDHMTHPSGHYVQDMGKLDRFSNGTFGMILVDDPSFLLHCIDL